MPDEAATAEAEETTTSTETEKTHEETVAYERFQKVNQKAKAEAEARKAADKRVAELTAQMEERESAGLPELERLKKEMERAQKRADDAEARAEQQEKAAITAGRKALVLAAAAAAGFDEADDALRYPEHVSLDDIESQADAERAVKRLAKAKPKLLKAEDSKPLPGRVMQNGRASTQQNADPLQAQREAEGNTILEGIRNLQRGWQSGGTL